MSNLTCAQVEQELRSELSKMPTHFLYVTAQKMGVDTSQLNSDKEIIDACVLVELHCFTH